MISKYLAAFLVGTALMSGVASAQTAPATKADSANAATTHKAGEWRASKLAGVDVYNEENEKIGDIHDIILDKSGKVANVILGVGGFLGMGEHYVAVPFDKLKWVNEPVRTTTSSTAPDPANKAATNVDSTARTASDGTPRTTTGAATTTTTTRTSSDSWYPDHVVYNATKDQLKAMPQFKY
jgi:sporulation protein YlmC with PRC-barrel domain